MQQIINFLIRNKTFITYLLLLLVSLGLTVQSHSYHGVKFSNSANWLTGGVYRTLNNFSDYLHLKTYNDQLAQENLRLRRILFNRDTLAKADSLLLRSLTGSDSLKFRVSSASVIKNSYSKQRNYILIDKGEKDSIKQDMGVIGPYGIIGIVETTSRNYATVQSLLNTLSEINAAVKNTNNFGSLQWDGKSVNIVQLHDLLRAAPIKKGDTIITGGMSSIFPKGIPIGTISDFSLDASENYYVIQVRLFNDMTRLDRVYLIENRDRAEIINLEERTYEQ